MTRENPSSLQRKHFFVRLRVTDASVSGLFNETALSGRADLLVRGGDWSQEQEIMSCQGVDSEDLESRVISAFCSGQTWEEGVPWKSRGWWNEGNNSWQPNDNYNLDSNFPLKCVSSTMAYDPMENLQTLTIWFNLLNHVNTVHSLIVYSFHIVISSSQWFIMFNSILYFCYTIL